MTVQRERHVAPAISSTHPAVRGGSLGLLGAVVAYAVVTDSITAPALFVGLFGAALALIAIPLLQPWRAVRGLLRLLLETGSVALGVAVMAPLLVLSIDVYVERFSLLFAVVMVFVAYTGSRPARMWLGGWTLVVWIVTLWWGGVRTPEILGLHLLGGLLLLGFCARTADALVEAVDVEGRNRREAERRAQLLTNVLRTNALEPAAVLRAVVEGMVDAGFDAVAIREVDHEAGELRLVDGHGTFGQPTLPVLALADAHLSREAMHRGEPVVVDEYDESPAVLHRGIGFRGTMVVPLRTDDGAVAVVIGASLSGRLSSAQIETAILLGEQAGRALDRARALEEDRRTVVQLRRLDLQMQDFVSTASHELRTPLTVLQGIGQTLMKRWDDLDEETRSDLLQRMDTNTERLAAMVRALLDSSALEGGEPVVTAERIALAPTVRGLARRLETLTQHHPVDLEVPDALEVVADPVLFEHVLENLLLNVAHHTPAGTRTRVVAEPAGDRVRITVADDGQGIAPDDLPHVLDRFYRGGAPTERSSGGLGLGLALAAQIVRAHGSLLEVDSEPGVGTTFRFHLRAADVSA